MHENGKMRHTETISGIGGWGRTMDMIDAIL
jgi:hypothetical protein